MSWIRVRAADLFYTVVGDGEPMVLVHGGLGDHCTWQAVVPLLAGSFRVVVYDRRGHSRSGRAPGVLRRREHEDDLAALMDALGVAPAYVVGSSYGGSTALGLLAREPERFRGVVVHEPPLLNASTTDPSARESTDRARAVIASAVSLIRAGETLAGVRCFLEEAALGPGTWEPMPTRVRRALLANAGAFADEQADPQWARLDTAGLSRYRGPALFTHGGAGPFWLAPITRGLAGVLPQARLRVLEEAGHVPHVTHPREYAALVLSFLGEDATRS